MSYLVGGCLAQSMNSYQKTASDSIIVDKSIIKDAKLTKYFYQAANMKKHPIYMSPDGKCFIIRASAKTGKFYRQYLPEITKKRVAE